MQEDTPNQTTQDEVAAFIAGRTPVNRAPQNENQLPEVPQVTVDLGDLPPGAEEFMRASAQPEDTTPYRPDEVDIPAATDPATPSVIQRRTWAYDDSTLGTIEVTQSDKMLYLKASANDVPLYLDIVLGHPGDEELKISANVRSLNHYEVSVIYRAVQLQVEDGIILKDPMDRPDPIQMVTWMQWYSACLQLVSVQGKGMKHLEFTYNPGNLEEDAETLRKHYTELHSNTQLPRWYFMLAATRVFEAKMAVCNQNYQNGNFWNPVSAA